MYVCVSRVAKGRQIGGWVEGGWREWGGGGVLQCERDGNWGEVCEGGRIHLFCIYLRRRPSEHG